MSYGDMTDESSNEPAKRVLSSDQPTDPLQVLTELYEASTQGQWKLKVLEHSALLFMGNDRDGYEFKLIGTRNAEWIAESHNLFPALKEQIDRLTNGWNNEADQLRKAIISLNRTEISKQKVEAEVKRLEAQKADPALNSLAEYAQETVEQRARAEKAEAEVKRLRELAQEINNNVNMALAGQIQNDDALANIDELVGAAIAESQEKE